MRREKSVINMTEKAGRTIEKKWFQKATNLALGVIFVFLFFLLGLSPADAGNQQLTFQGKLTNSSGNTVSDGTYYLKLTIYDAATGGSCQYTASSTCSSVTSTPVTVTNGIFSINLGDTSASLAAISPTLFNNSALYLGITVCSGAGTGCDSEMTPRKRLTAAPYAFNADYLSGLATSTIGGTGSYVPVTDSSGNLKITNSLFAATTTAGQFGVGTTTIPSGVKTFIDSTTASDKLLVIRANSSQTGSLQEWQNNAGTALVLINSSGNISTSGTLATFGNATVGGHLYPSTDNLYDIGASSTQWRYGNFQGGVLIANGSTTSTLLNNSLVLGQTTDYNSGMFNVDSSGNVSTSGSIQVSIGEVANAFRVYNASAGTNVMRMDTDAYKILFDESNTSYEVGIGTSNPLERLTVIGNVASADGSTTSTLTKNSLKLGQTSTAGVGTFYVDSSGNVSATGSIKTFANVTSTGNLYALSGSASTSILNGSSLTLGQGTGYNSGMFSVDANGNIFSSSTLNVAGGPNPVGSVWHPTHKSSITDTASYNLKGNYSVFVSGNYAYIASQEENALTIIDVSNPASTTYKGTYSSATFLSGARSVFVSGNYAYVVAYAVDTLAVIDISNPANPVLKGFLTDGTNLNNPNSVFVSGNYAYIVASTGAAAGNLAIVDISNPSNPVLKSTISDGTGDAALAGNTSVFVSGKYAYVTAGYGAATDALEIIDVSNPLSPTHAGKLVDDGTNSNILMSGPQTVFVSGIYAYITATSEDGLEIVDISNPANPVHKGSIADGAGGALLNNPWSLFVSGNYAYVGSQTSDAVEIIDISNPASPAHKGSIANGAGGASLVDPYGIFVSGNYVYVATYGNTTSGALEIIDVSGASISNARIGALSVDTLQTTNFAQFDQNLSVRGGLNVSGPTQLLGDVSIGGGRATSTNMAGGGLTIFTNQTSSTFTSRVFDITGSTGFIFNSGTSTWTGSDRNLVSFQTNGTDKFLFAADGSMIVNKASGYNSGKFYVDSSGNTSVSGTLTAFGNVNFNSGVTLGDDVADRITVTGILGTINISNGTTATTTITNNTLILGQGSGYNQGVFKIGNTGDVNASGTITSAVGFVAAGGVFATSLSDTYSTTLGDSDAADGDWTRVYGTLAMGATPTGNAQIYLKASSTTAVPLLIQNESGGVISQFSSSSASIILNGTQGTLQGFSVLNVGNSSGQAGVINLQNMDGSTTGLLAIYRTTSSIGAQLTSGNLLLGSGSNTSTLTSNSLLVGQGSGYNQGVFNVDSLGNVSASGTWQVFGAASTGGLKISASNTTTTITSLVSGAGAGAFVLNTNTSLAVASSSILLSVRNNGSKVFSVDATGYVTATGTIQANNTNPGPGDVAEFVNLAAGETVEAGDVVIVDTNGLNQYRKSDTAYAKNVAGVISGSGAFLIGAGGSNRAPLALAGLVKVKVTDENGSIGVGDYLVSASKPGHAMKYDSGSGKSAGLVGMALEPLAAGEGRILILINKGLMAESVRDSAGLNVSVNEQGQLVTNGGLDMAGRHILNVLSVKSKENKWMIDEEGYLVMKVKTKQGDKDLYSLQSGQDKELVLSGSSQLENGLKKIELPLIDQEVIDPTASIKVSVTLTGEAKGVFVSEKNYQGFTVKELGNGTSNATFDWMLIAKRRPADFQESTDAESESVPVAPEVSSSTPSEESTSASASIETPIETPLDTSPTPEASASAAEPVIPPVETPPAPPVE